MKDPQPGTTPPMTKALVVGAGVEWWVEYENALSMLDNINEWDIVVINGVGSWIQAPIQHWVSLHPDRLLGWMDQREKNGYNQDYQAWGSFLMDFEDARIKPWHRMSSGGSSGLFAVEVALYLGATKIILCGIPLDGHNRINYDKNSYESIQSADTNQSYQVYAKGWIEQLPKLENKVKSMSGWTQALLGSPTQEWLNS